MGEDQGIIESSTVFERGGTWTAIWKEDKRANFRDCILTVGLCGSYEEVCEKLKMRLDADPFFARRFQGGVFWPILVSGGVKVPATGWKPGVSGRQFVVTRRAG